MGIPFHGFSLAVDCPTPGLVEFPARWKIRKEEVWKRAVFTESNHPTPEYYRRLCIELDFFSKTLKNYQALGATEGGF